MTSHVFDCDCSIFKDIVNDDISQILPLKFVEILDWDRNICHGSFEEMVANIKCLDHRVMQSFMRTAIIFKMLFWSWTNYSEFIMDPFALDLGNISDVAFPSKLLFRLAVRQTSTVIVQCTALMVQPLHAIQLPESKSVTQDGLVRTV